MCEHAFRRDQPTVGMEETRALRIDHPGAAAVVGYVTPADRGRAGDEGRGHGNLRAPSASHTARSYLGDARVRAC